MEFVVAVSIRLAEPWNVAGEMGGLFPETSEKRSGSTPVDESTSGNKERGFVLTMAQAVSLRPSPPHPPTHSGRSGTFFTGQDENE